MQLWPYVNGKAIVSGIRLEELDASDMLDVIHYFFEEDVRYTTAEEAKALDQLRTNLYRDLYDRPYKYASKPSSGFSTAGGSFDLEPENPEPVSQEEVKPFNPRQHKEPTKSYIPATALTDDDADPFGGVLDAPIG